MGSDSRVSGAVSASTAAILPGPLQPGTTPAPAPAPPPPPEPFRGACTGYVTVARPRGLCPAHLAACAPPTPRPVCPAHPAACLPRWALLAGAVSHLLRRVSLPIPSPPKLKLSQNPVGRSRVFSLFLPFFMCYPPSPSLNLTLIIPGLWVPNPLLHFQSKIFNCLTPLPHPHPHSALRL